MVGKGLVDAFAAHVSWDLAESSIDTCRGEGRITPSLPRPPMEAGAGSSREKGRSRQPGITHIHHNTIIPQIQKPPGQVYGTDPLCWIPVDSVATGFKTGFPEQLLNWCVVLVSSDGGLFLAMERDNRRGRSILMRQDPFDSDNFPFGLVCLFTFRNFFIKENENVTEVRKTC